MKNCRIVEFKYDNGDTKYKIENRVLRTNFFGKKHYEWVPFMYLFNFDRLVIPERGERYETRKLGWQHTKFKTLEEAEYALPQFEEEFNRLNKPDPKIVSKTAFGDEESEIYHQSKFELVFNIVLRTTLVLFFIGFIIWGIILKSW